MMGLLYISDMCESKLDGLFWGRFLYSQCSVFEVKSSAVESDGLVDGISCFGMSLCLCYFTGG